MNLAIASVIISVAAVPHRATAQPVEVEFIGFGAAGTSISADGSVVAGNMINDTSYETFRWTESTGVVRLGRATVPVLGRGAGTPDVSYDGTRVSATVLSSDNTQLTFGLWTDGIGWQVEDAIPMGPEAASVDQSIASTWGLSGDGTTVTGFYWTNNARAYPATWSPAGGAVPLERPGPLDSCRVNDSNYDGTVVGGWSEHADGSWLPTVWNNGVMTVLDPTPAGVNMVNAVSADGETLVGSTYSAERGHQVSTIWNWDGAAWNATQLDVLPGTAFLTGLCEASGVSDDGDLVVGYNRFQFGPNSDGFVWTPGGGVRNVYDVLSDGGYELPPSWDILDATAVSADGSSFLFLAFNSVDGFGTFRVTFVDPCPADLDGNGVLNLDDIDAFVAGFLAGDLAVDLDGNGTLNVDDIDAFVSAFVAGCSESE